MMACASCRVGQFEKDRARIAEINKMFADRDAELALRRARDAQHCLALLKCFTPKHKGASE